ncbi:patatin [Neisseria chenwenguii]|uniref:Patatin n=1 Tax=Neisseria chenwenguii TaxID=1853278 RepID=A0A220S3S5_9NEIS|nr:patatin-like phospholipase family protein [Neisseria chenwenguii]ASK28159.1 patatin [Neisseria chenwenguii]
MLKRYAKPLAAAAALLLSACSLVRYQPLEPITKVDLDKGYRLENQQRIWDNKDTLVILMFSGGGTRAAALGYGVLEQLNQHKVRIGGKDRSLLENVDLVVGVSGGSVLAAYYSLHGAQTIPSFYRRFLRQNFQRLVTKQVFSAANLPRLASPEYGRGDLLQEQFETHLFGKATFDDLEKRRKGPFAIISATDMGLGERINFTQEYFDPMCINLGRLRIARAVAASSAVPLVFAPVTVNNNGGHCGYTLPARYRSSSAEGLNRYQNRTRRELLDNIRHYENSRGRPYIHLLDGGLTDNLGLRSLLDVADFSSAGMKEEISRNIRRIVVINVNAQNQITNTIDQSAAIPSLRGVVSAIVDIPIDKYSQDSLRRFRALADQWNAKQQSLPEEKRIALSFISLNLRDLPESELRRKVLNTPTSFYLPPNDVDNLRTAAAELMKHSQEYQKLLQELSARPNAEALFAEAEDIPGETAKSRKSKRSGKTQPVQTAPQADLNPANYRPAWEARQ